eukprot:TRINITY_DN650_c0_g1_i1.p1 TRINITY_DN650_c0_g1~~TRINITY_DN650_c0_g1_i1.p1  ORF type:complete len:133 (-),score=70.66 TRINITY_DN650_c0_g1_i1:107-505(-)
MTQVANKVAQGGGTDGTDEHILVAAAKEVAKSTAQLVAASRAKSDPGSRIQQKLSEASKTVAMATNALMNAAKTAMERQEAAKQQEIEAKGFTMTEDKIREMEQQAKILKLEKELQDARKSMLEGRKKVYGK